MVPGEGLLYIVCCVGHFLEEVGFLPCKGRKKNMEYLSTCIVDFLLLPMQRGFPRINKNLPISNPQMPRRVALQSKCIATNAMEQQLRRRKAAGAPHPILIATTHLSTQRTLVVNTPRPSNCTGWCFWGRIP